MHTLAPRDINHSSQPHSNNHSLNHSETGHNCNNLGHSSGRNQCNGPRSNGSVGSSTSTIAHSPSWKTPQSFPWNPWGWTPPPWGMPPCPYPTSQWTRSTGPSKQVGILG